MTKTHRGLISIGMAALALACDGDGQTATGSGLSGDCPIGMFRPVGLADCVFAADDANGNPLTTSDDRCAVGQPVVPPSCVGLEGERPYLSASMTCARGYRFEPGVCNRDTSGFAGTTGAAGDIFTGGAGDNGNIAGAGGGAAGATGAAGVGGFTGGAAGAGGFTGAAGIDGLAGVGAAGAPGFAGQNGL